MTTAGIAPSPSSQLPISVKIPIHYTPQTNNNTYHHLKDEKENTNTTAAATTNKSRLSSSSGNTASATTTTTTTSNRLPPEWAMIELNGELISPIEIPDSNSTKSILGAEGRIELGLLQWQGKNPIMILGSHQLTGKIETLKEPFCVMERRRGNSNDDNTTNDNTTTMNYMNDTNGISSSSSSTSYHIVGVVRRKFLFNQYPKSIMR